MTDKERYLIFEVNSGQISVDDFYRQFPLDIRESKDYVIREIKNSIARGNIEELDLSISLIWLSGISKQFVEILNELLINPNHRSHQFIAKSIQEIKDPSSVSFIRKVLVSNFDYLAYTGSDKGAIAKWFSWALYEIGTKEAIELMEEYSNSGNAEIKNEMIQKLNKAKVR